MLSVGICVVSREDYPEFCRISADCSPDADDYDAWLERIEEYSQSMVAKGGRAVKIYIKPADLLAWCKARGLEVNSSSRADYAAFRMIELNKK